MAQVKSSSSIDLKTEFHKLTWQECVTALKTDVKKYF